MTDLTKHGEIRCNQRGIRMFAIDLIVEFAEFFEDREYLVTNEAKILAVGECKQQIAALSRSRPDGWREEVRRLKRIVQQFDKLAGKIVAGGFESGRIKVVTGYHMDQGQMKTRIRRNIDQGYYS